MTDMAVPAHDLAVANFLDRYAVRIRQGARPREIADEMRWLADILERKI